MPGRRAPCPEKGPEGREKGWGRKERREDM